MKKMGELGLLVKYGAEKCNEAYERFGSEAEKAVEWLKSSAQSAVEGAKDKISDVKENVKEKMADAQDKLHDTKHQAHQKKEHVETKIDEHQSRAKEAFMKKMTEMGLIVQYGAERVNQAWDEFGSDAEKAAEWIKSGVKHAAHEAKETLHDAKEKTKEKVGAVKRDADKEHSYAKAAFMKKMTEMGLLTQYGPERLDQAFQKFGSDAEQAVEWIKSGAKAAAHDAKDKIYDAEDMTAERTEALKKHADKHKAKLQEDGSAVKVAFMKKMVEMGLLVQYGAEKCQEAFEKFGGEAEKAAEWLKSSAKSAVEDVKDKAADMKETVKKGAEKVKEKVQEATTTDADRKEAKKEFEKREEVREEMARRAARPVRHADPTQHAHKPKVHDEL
jgi:ElaB/YqjD/DUF883 family membrane-anchored ribosome-binding protein